MNYPLTLPSYVSLKSYTLEQRNNSLANVSAFTFQTQIVQRFGQCWQLSLEVKPLAEPYAQQFQNWLNSLQGYVGTAKIYHPYKNIGTRNGTFSVTAGVSPMNNKILIGSNGAGLAAGDYATINDQLVQLQSAWVNTSTYVDVYPRIRTNPAGMTGNATNGAIYGIWRLSADTAPVGKKINGTNIWQFPTINFSEAIA